MYTRYISRNIYNVSRLKSTIIYKNKFEKKVEGTVFEKWINCCKNVYKDYKEVAIDLKKDIRQKPVKATGYLSFLTFLGFCNKMNPDEVNFRDAVLKSMADIILVNLNLQRLESIQHVQFLEKYYNSNLIKRQSFGIFSLIWIDDETDCVIYECSCPYLKLTNWQFFKKIVDIGFLNKWWLLDKHMIDYDVNF